jgi:hypothetical protein
MLSETIPTGIDSFEEKPNAATIAETLILSRGKLRMSSLKLDRNCSVYGHTTCCGSMRGR